MMKQLLMPFAFIAAALDFAHADQVIVAARVIYPGQQIAQGAIRQLEAGADRQYGPDFAHDTAEIAGKLAASTILPGRPIALAQVREPDVIEAGQPVRIRYTNAGLTLSLRAMPLTSASAGDVIRVRNMESGKSVSGRVLPDGSVEVAPQ